MFLTPGGTKIKKIGAAVIGLGYWGPNIVRNLMAHAEVDVIACFDLKPERRGHIKNLYQSIEMTNGAQQIIKNPDIDLIAICTPVESHFNLAKEALSAGKHVLIEKPMTETSDQGIELIQLSKKYQKQIFTDHTFLFTGAVQHLKKLVDQGTLGELYYFDSIRVNLGLFRHDVNVIWDLAAHDVSIMHYLLNQDPQSIVATGARHIENNLEDLAYLTVYYADNLLAHINVSWLSPVKVRQTLLAGSKKMVVWDDNHPSEKIKIYDKGVETTGSDLEIYQTLVQYRTGDMTSPKIDTREALAVEIDNIVGAIKGDQKPISDGQTGLAVVKILELAQKSIENRGKEFQFKK